jgi:hypothetical protein
MADFAVGPQVVRADDVARINLVPRHELIDLDGAGGFQGDVFEFFLGDLYVGVGVNLEGLDDVFARDLLAGLGIHAAVFNAVASVSVDLIEADLFGIGGGRVQRDRTGDKGQTKETFPIGSRGHTQNSVSGAARIQDDRERLVPTSRLVPCGYLYRLTGVISRKAARGLGRGERHRLSQPIRLP